MNYIAQHHNIDIPLAWGIRMDGKEDHPTPTRSELAASLLNRIKIPQAHTHTERTIIVWGAR